MSNLPFVEEILADLRRFKECAEDDNDVYLERSRFDLLVQLGLLERVQRSPARWMMTQAGEDAIAQPAAGEPLTVWCGSMPESNGKTNWTAILHRKGDGLMDGPHMTIARSEYPDRVRYEADQVRHIIGELAEEPDILAYDADAHSGYKAPPAAAHGDEAVRKDAAAAYVDMSCNSVLIDGATCYYLPAERMTAFDRMFSLGDAMRSQGDGGADHA